MVPPDLFRRNSVETWFVDSLARIGILPPPGILFLGDSHLRPARYADAQGWFSPYPCRFVEVGGATAVGLRHPTSKTQALVKYRKVLRRTSRRNILVFQLGEVDCGFVIWHRAAKYNEDIDTQLQQALTAYTDFLREVARMGFKQVVVTSAMLPTIHDGQLDGEVARLRHEVTASLSERTKLTMRFNRELAAAVKQIGLDYLDFSDALMDPATSLVRDRFRHYDPADHHLHPDEGGRLWASRLLPMITEQGKQ